MKPLYNMGFNIFLCVRVSRSYSKCGMSLTKMNVVGPLNEQTTRIHYLAQFRLKLTSCSVISSLLYDESHAELRSSSQHSIWGRHSYCYDAIRCLVMNCQFFSTMFSHLFGLYFYSGLKSQLKHLELLFFLMLHNIVAFSFIFNVFIYFRRRRRRRAIFNIYKSSSRLDAWKIMFLLFLWHHKNKIEVANWQ